MYRKIRSTFAGAVALLGLMASAPQALAQAKTEISLSRQPGIYYMPTHIIEKQKLIEKHAGLLGLPNITTKWITFSGGGVKGIVACSAQPMALISRDANIKSLRDIGPNDKIAVPTVKISTQAVVLQIAAAEMFGADQWSKLDANTVQLGHPDAYAALSNSQHEVRNHFSIPPFTFLELKNVPGAHVVLSSPDVMGGPVSQAQFFTTTKFADANPKIIQAVRDATKEAQDLIRNDTRTAVEIYKEVTGDKTAVDDLLAWLKEPGMMEWNLEPQGTMKFANHLFKTGTLKTQPKAWTDYYLPIAHDLKGN